MRALLHIASLLCFAANVASADEAALRQDLLGLAGEGKARKEALFSLARSGDPRVEFAITQFRLESLYVWSNTVVQCAKLDEKNGSKFAPLSDALTGAALQDAAGQPLVVPAEQVTAISAGRADRKVAMTALSLLDLSAPASPPCASAARRRRRQMPSIFSSCSQPMIR